MISLIRKIDTWIAGRPGRASTMLSWLSQGLSIGANLVILPLVLYRVGADAGIWFFLMTWTGMFTLFDFGFSQCISRQITFSLGKQGIIPGSPKGRFIRVGGARTIGRTIAASRMLFRMVSVVILLIGIVAERTFLFSGHMAAGMNAHVCWYLIIAASVILNENRVYSTALTGMLLIAQLRIISLFQNLIQNGCIILFLLICPRLELMGAAILIGSLFGWWRVTSLWKHRRPPGITMSPVKWSIVASLWRSSWEQGVASASNYFTSAVNPILIGYLLGGQAVAAYYLPLRIATILFSSISEIIGPQINFMIALYRDHHLHGFLVRFFRIFIVVTLISFVAYSAFAIAGPWAVQVWSIGKVAPVPALFWIMSLYYFTVMLQTLLACFITAHGLQPFARPALAGAVLNVSLLFILIPLMGLVGAALATFLAQLLTTNWFVAWYSARLLKEDCHHAPFRVALRDAVGSLKHDLEPVFGLFRSK